MCLEKRLPLERNTPTIGYKLLIKKTSTGTLHFIINGEICGSGMLTAKQVRVKYDTEDSTYASGFHYSATLKYLSYLLQRHGRTLKIKIERTLGLKPYAYDLVICKVSVRKTYAKGNWWSDIHGGDVAYVAKHMEVLEEVETKEELCTASSAKI
jgi:hypothetical protein